MKKYTPQQIEFLRAGYLSMNTKGLAKAFNSEFGLDKTAGQIKAVLNNHKILCGRKGNDRLINRFLLFTAEQVNFLVENYVDISAPEMMELFNEHFKTDMTLQQIKTAVHNRGINSGRTGRFEKGNVPFTKGTKGFIKPNSGSFKKGTIPPNRKPLGTERICSKDGFILIKIKEKNPYTGFSTRYKHKHVYVWEQEHGPVPKGFVVALKDSDKTNCDPENLMLISRAVLLKLNRHGYKEMPADLKPSVLALAKLQVKTFAKEKDINQLAG